MKNLLHHAFSISNVEHIQNSVFIDQTTEYLSKQIRVYSNSDTNRLQEFSILYIMTQTPTFKMFEAAKKIFPLIAEVRTLHIVDNTAYVSSILKSYTFCVDHPNIENESAKLRARLFFDHFPYVFNFETQSEQKLYEAVPSQFIVAQLRGKFGIEAPYHF